MSIFSKGAGKPRFAEMLCNSRAFLRNTAMMEAGGTQEMFSFAEVRIIVLSTNQLMPEAVPGNDPKCLFKLRMLPWPLPHHII